MGLPLLLLALGGGTVADGYFNNGNMTRKAGDVIGDAFGNIAGGGQQQIPGISNLGQGDQHNTGQKGLMDLLGSSEGIMGGGGIAGALALQFTGAPDFAKKIAWGAAILNLVFQAYKMFTKNDFGNSANGQGVERQRHIVMRDGFDPNDPNIVGQTAGKNGPDPAPVYEVTNE